MKSRVIFTFRYVMADGFVCGLDRAAERECRTLAEAEQVARDTLARHPEFETAVIGETQTHRINRV